MNARVWMMQYGVAIGLSCFFGLVLGQVPFFRETAVGKLAASDLVQFLGYGSALVLGWVGARQLNGELPEDWKRLTPYRALIVPLATLVCCLLSYGVLSLLCGPFLTKLTKPFYNWAFILGIVGTVSWLIYTWVFICAPLVVEAAPKRLKKAA
ncbi:MAG: hypothetical protein U0412_05445 [Nitrospira sp.]